MQNLHVFIAHKSTQVDKGFSRDSYASMDCCYVVHL